MNVSALEELLQKANSIKIDTSDSDWYDLWHFHPDMAGAGNENSEARQVCLQALQIAYEKILEQLKDWGTSYQSWILINPTDSGQDAVYVHTPNPNKQNFPYQFDGADWSIKVPSWITKVFPAKSFRLGQSIYQGNVVYWVRRI